ncbi:MAG: hypothetical protein LBU51_04795 [Bacteroidales bacterium]|jgi:hypothetical protein|nr:hypothetical protein [Bacteroidales bacterium]
MKKSFIIFSAIGFLFSFSIQAQSITKVPDKLTKAPDTKKVHTTEVKEMLEKTCCVIDIKRNYYRTNFKITEDARAERFWNYFDAYVSREQEVHENFNKALEANNIQKEHGIVNFDNLNDKQIWLFFDLKKEHKKFLADNDDFFYSKIKECLNAKEVVEYLKLERSFKKEVVDVYKSKR